MQPYLLKLSTERWPTLTNAQENHHEVLHPLGGNVHKPQDRGEHTLNSVVISFKSIYVSSGVIRLHDES